MCIENKKKIKYLKILTFSSSVSIVLTFRSLDILISVSAFFWFEFFLTTVFTGDSNSLCHCWRKFDNAVSTEVFS